MKRCVAVLRTPVPVRRAAAPCVSRLTRPKLCVCGVRRCACALSKLRRYSKRWVRRARLRPRSRSSARGRLATPAVRAPLRRWLPRAPLPRAPPPRPRHSLCSVACRSKTPWHGARADARAERHAAARALQMLPSQLRASAPSVRTVTGCCGIRACGSQQEHRRVLRGRRMSTRKQHSRSASKHLSRACARRTCLIMISTKSQVST